MTLSLFVGSYITEMKGYSALTIHLLLLMILLLSFCVQRTKAEGGNSTTNTTEAGEDRASKCIITKKNLPNF